MAPQFTTPCYVRIDDAGKRKEICEKLEQIGYSKMLVWYDEDERFVKISPALEVCGTNSYAPQYYTFNGLQSKQDPLIDCGTNTDLFLALAGMRSDTIVNQWYIAQSNIMFKKLKGEVITANKKRYVSIGGMFMPLTENVQFTWFGGNPQELFRKATTAEIIEHFNKKTSK